MFVVTRSNRLPRAHPLRMPSQTPTTVAMIVAEPTSRRRRPDPVPGDLPGRQVVADGLSTWRERTLGVGDELLPDRLRTDSSRSRRISSGSTSRPFV